MDNNKKFELKYSELKIVVIIIKGIEFKFNIQGSSMKIEFASHSLINVAIANFLTHLTLINVWLYIYVKNN